MPDNTRWSIPAHVVAHSRAAYYAAADQARAGADYDLMYHVEYQYAMRNDYELTDWASNSMDWADVQEEAVLVSMDEAAVPYARAWSSADKQVIERPEQHECAGD
jgi:hypothetical protein